MNNLKLRNKFIIIYRNNKKEERISTLMNFRQICKKKFIKLFIANNKKLAVRLKADGVYISSYNRNKIYLQGVEFIGSAHNISEINIKKWQGCKSIFLSRLFETDYKNKKGHLGLIKFNLINLNKDFVPLGGIRLKNLNKVKIIKSNSLAILSEVKKKPAKIFNRLF